MTLSPLAWTILHNNAAFNYQATGCLSAAVEAELLARGSSADRGCGRMSRNKPMETRSHWT